MNPNSPDLFTIANAQSFQRKKQIDIIFFIIATSNKQSRRSAREFFHDNLGIFVGVFLALFYFVFAALIQIIYLQTNYEDGAIFIKFYSHLYLYPAFFGWICVLLLIYPVKFLYSKKILAQKRFKIYFFLIFILSVAMVIIDTASKNVAPFEIKAEILENDPDLKDHFKNTPSDENRKKLSDKDRNELPDEDRQKYDNDKKKFDEANKKYQDKMLQLIENYDNWSLARFFHYISIFVQIISIFITGFITLVLIHYTFSKSFDDTYEFRAAYLCCVYVVPISYLWLLMFVAFEHQKQVYFFGVSNPAAFYVILCGFFMVTLILPLKLIKWIGGDVGNNFLAFVFLLVGACSALFFVTSNKDTLVILFGKNAEITSYFIPQVGILIFLTATFALFYKDPKNRGRYREPIGLKKNRGKYRLLRRNK